MITISLLSAYIKAGLSPSVFGLLTPRLSFGTRSGCALAVPSHIAAIEGKARKTGLDDRIRIEGPNRHIPDVLQELDIFVMSSTSEGLPQVILEAMATGLPVVSTRVEGISEVTPEEEVSMLCEPGSARELADAMYRAATSCNLARMGKRAREIAIAKFSLAQMCHNYRAVYAEALSRH